LIGDERWRNNWLVVSPAGAVRVDVERSRARRRALERRVRDLPAGTPVVLCGSAPGAIRRCRSFASATGIELEREYLAFPSVRAPGYLVEDAPAPVGAFVKRLLVAPPRTALSTPMQVCLSLLRNLGPWRAIRTIAPGRAVVGRRT
jgi:hypothetical protein